LLILISTALYILGFGVIGMHRALQDYPDAKGWVYANDDLAWNWWQLSKIDLSFPTYARFSSLIVLIVDVVFFLLSFPFAEPRFYSLGPEYDVSFLNNNFGLQKVENLRQVFLEVQSIDPIYIRNLKSNFEGRCAPVWEGQCFLYDTSDFFYLPASSRSATLKVLSVFRKYDVMNEFSFPTAFAMIAPKSELKTSFGGAHLRYEYHRREATPEIWTPNHIFVHPIKFSTQSHFLGKWCKTHNEFLKQKFG
jgi:hypothetical protein